MTGLSPDKAKIAVDPVIYFLKSKLPPGLAGQLDGVLKGATGLPDDLTQGLGGLSGGKKK